jgi:hypothetical protein
MVRGSEDRSRYRGSGLHRYELLYMPLGILSSPIATGGADTVRSTQVYFSLVSGSITLVL